MLRVAAKIALLEQECGLDTSVEDYQSQFKFGLAEVVYQWAMGTVRMREHLCIITSCLYVRNLLILFN